MDKIKEKLHIGSSRRKSQADNDAYAKESGSGGFGTIEGMWLIYTYFGITKSSILSLKHFTPSAPTCIPSTTQHHTNPPTDNRDSIDSELAAMPPQERVAYLKEFEDSDKHGEPKRGGLIEKLIARGNKKTEDQLEREAKERDAARAQVGPGAGASTQSAAGPGGL